MKDFEEPVRITSYIILVEESVNAFCVNADIANANIMSDMYFNIIL